jgi:hypothetical protein
VYRPGPGERDLDGLWVRVTAFDDHLLREAPGWLSCLRLESVIDVALLCLLAAFGAADPGPAHRAAVRSGRPAPSGFTAKAGKGNVRRQTGGKS